MIGSRRLIEELVAELRCVLARGYYGRWLVALGSAAAGAGCAGGQAAGGSRQSRTVASGDTTHDGACDGAMRPRGRAAWCACWWLLCVLGARAAPLSRYCERADVAWRAYRAPHAFEARVLSLARDAATVQVRRTLRRQAHWPKVDQVLRLRLPAETRECSGRFELPLRNRRTYIVFAERRGREAVALGPPLRRSPALVKRVRAVYKPGYSECRAGHPRGARPPSRLGPRAPRAHLP